MLSNGGGRTGLMLRICTRTWARDSHDLFDYETHDAKQLTERHFASSHGLRLLRAESEITAITGTESISDVGSFEMEADHLLTVISRNPGEYIISSADRHHGQPVVPHRLWLVVRAMHKKRHALQEQDVIKLGRYRLRVRRIVRDDELKDFDVTSLLDSPVPDVTSPNSDDGVLQCRICLAEGTKDDKLLCPCECKGSIKYVHAECMRRWVHLRAIKDSKESDFPLKAALLSEGTCELCKTVIPPFVRLDGELVPLVMMPELTSRFIILENVKPNSGRSLHFISVPGSDCVMLGRGHDVAVRIADVSISRNHASIYYEEGKFYLEDHDSKFGTLVALRRPVQISEGELMAVQIGRSLIELRIDPSLAFAEGCVDLDSVTDCFRFCGALNSTPGSFESRTSDMSISRMATPVSASPLNGVEETASENFDPAIFFRPDISPSALNSQRPNLESYPLPLYFSENTPISDITEVINNARPVEYAPFCLRSAWVPLHRCSNSTPVQEHCSVTSADGTTYLSLMMQPPPRSQVLRGLRYSNRRNINIRDGHRSDASTCPLLRNIRLQPIQSRYACTATNECYLPENAFTNTGNSHVTILNQGAPNATENEALATPQVPEGPEGAMQWNQNQGSTVPSQK